MKKGHRSIQDSWRAALWVFVAPALCVMFLIVLVPLIYLLRNSLMYWQMSQPRNIHFAGLSNFLQMIADHHFYHSLAVTGVFVVGAVALQIVFALIMAEILNTSFYGRKLVQGLLILPMVTAPIVVGVLWRMLLNSDLGLINYFVKSTLGFSVNWLGSDTMALVSLVGVDVWQWTPFVLVMFLASYSSVPSDYYDAAEVDGAGRWQKFTRITLPLVFPMIIFAVLFRVTEAFKVFPKIFIMTNGGPGFSTETLNFYTYRMAFSYTDIGYSSALGIAMLLFSLILIVSLNVSLRRVARIG